MYNTIVIRHDMVDLAILPNRSIYHIQMNIKKILCSEIDLGYIGLLMIYYKERIFLIKRLQYYMRQYILKSFVYRAYLYISRTKSERAFTKVSFISFLLKAFLQRTNYFTAFVSLR